MKDIADNAKAIEVLTELQNLPHETHDVGYGLNNAQSYNYKTGIFTSDAAQAIDYVVRRMRRKEDVSAEVPAALKKAVADSYGMVDNLIDGMSPTKFSLRLKSAIEETETNPSDAQKESGNYKKGHIKFGGYDYTIENPKGSTRSGKDANGKEWKVTMHDTYGYIRGKFGKDGDHLDMFINDKADLDNWNGDVFVVDQVNPDGSFDEHKVMYGYDSMNDAEKAYLANYSKGWQGLGNITGASKAEFDKWLDTSNRKLKPFADYAKVKFSQAQSVSEPRYSLKDIKPIGVGAFGNIYNQFRGKSKAAIEFLKKLGSGEATAALHHHTIGDISLVWGDKKTGLDKILRKHPEVVDNLQSIIDSMEVVQESDNRIKLESPTHFAVVSKEYKGEPREQWLLTAYEKRESLENDKSMDTATSSLGGDTALSQSKGSAAKIDNSSETSKENGEKFSLKDEKTMFGMHNISLDKLRKAIKQGGFAAPSMGVIDSKNGIYSGYGEITLIPKAEKIAKRTGKNIGTYAADAWTPIYPPVEKKFGGNGGDVAYDDIESVPKEMQRLTRNAINSFMDGREANGLAYLYLQEKGKAPELVHVEGKYPKELHDEVKGILGKLNGIYNTTDEQKEKLLDLFIREVYDGNKEEFDNDIKKFIKKDEELIKKRPNSNIAKNKQLDVDWMKEHGYDYGALSRFVDGILRDAETSGKVDENATMKAAQQYIQDKGMKEDFDSWKEKLNDRYNVEEVIFAGYKPDGNRKYLPNTVENAVKVMKQDGKNASVGSASFSHFVASILKPMGTLDQIRKKKGNLTGNYEDVEKFQEKWQPVYDELADKMQPDAEPFESYGMDRLEEVATQKNPKKYAKEEYGVDLTDEDINKLNELIEAVKNDKPSIYFETKFMRPYGLDEFEKAIVPNDTPSDVVDALKMAGIDVSSYERGNAEDRQKVTMDAINSSDNIRFSLKSMMAKPEGWKQANKKAIHIAEAIERDPKFSLKNLDGTLIKAGTYFSGGGLVEEGLKGIIDPVVAVEYDEKISGVYRNNFGQHIVTADVRDVDPKELVKQIDGEVEYFHASPVCKNYSQAKSNHAEVELDKETAASTAEFINAIKPKVVTIENVKGYKDSEAMKIITDALDANGYTWDADVYNAADYGGYTNRERLIVRAVRDGKLPEKPKKMAHKSGWYEAVADIIPTLTEKKNGVAPWMDIRLKADGIDWRNIDKPLYVMGSAYADGKIPHAFADELLPTLRTKSGDVIVMPNGKVYRAMGRVLARVSGVSDDYKMPFSENLSHTIIGNGIPTQLTEHVIAPLLTGSEPSKRADKPE
jgi:site-specific DNA-cytosine methylase